MTPLMVFFLEMTYPCHRTVLKRAAVEDPEQDFKPPPDATGLLRGLEDLT